MAELVVPDDGPGEVRTLPADEFPCVLHAYHSPHVERTHVHHILPLAWGGTNTKGNLAPCCPTGHDSVHVLLDRYKRENGLPPWDFRKSFGPAEREMAAEGWARR